MRSDLKGIHDNGEETATAAKGEDDDEEEEREEQDVFDLRNAFI